MDLFYTKKDLIKTLTNYIFICPMDMKAIKPLYKETMNTTNLEATVIKFKRFVNAYETAKELFPELSHQQWLTLADCLVEAVFTKD